MSMKRFEVHSLTRQPRVLRGIVSIGFRPMALCTGRVRDQPVPFASTFTKGVEATMVRTSQSRAPDEPKSEEVAKSIPTNRLRSRQSTKAQHPLTTSVWMGKCGGR